MPGRLVEHLHRGVGGVDVLAAGTARVRGLDLEIFVADLHIDVFGLGQHRHGRGRGVDAPLASVAGTRCTRCTPASKRSWEYTRSPETSAMSSLKPPADASLMDRTSTLPAAPLGVARVHAEQVGGEQRGLFAARAAPDLEHGVARVVGIARQQQQVELLRQSLGLALELGNLQLWRARAARGPTAPRGRLRAASAPLGSARIRAPARSARRARG